MHDKDQNTLLKGRRHVGQLFIKYVNWKTEESILFL